jgi:ubiquinone/menaquinone biosynthesis C-methylase UbiE
MKTDSLHDHYDQPDLTARILAALEQAGFDIDALACSDLELLDEFHLRGHAATRELALAAALQPDHHVLDLGCGIGGPARHLATVSGCRVEGLDLVASYCEAATELTRRVGLADRVRFLQGDMRALPYADETFDRVWSQHALMNIPDKAALAAEARRVLRPRGKVVLYEVCAGDGKSVHLPVPWAGVAGHSHLVMPAEMRRIWTAMGLREEAWHDVTKEVIAWLDGVTAGLSNKRPGARPRPGLGLLMGPDAALKSANLGRNLREGRVVVAWGVFAA